MKAVITPEIQAKLDELEEAKVNHDFWDNDLFKACREGTLTREDWRYIFAQYYLYNKSFTRYLTAVMTNCENDYYRAKLSENLWEEAGESKAEERHAEIFRKFLTNTLDIELDAIEYQDFSKLFHNEYMHACINNDAMFGSAFLSLGTEGIVSQMYEILVEGMVKAGIPNEELTFFHIHIGCDDEHAETLAEMMASYADLSGWRGTCLRATDQALTLRKNFFNNLFETVWLNRVSEVADGITERKSLKQDGVEYVAKATGLYSNKDDAQNIELNVERLNVSSQVLDPRINRIPAGKNTENHKHAHETVIYITQGSARIVIDGEEKNVATGEAILVPRWCDHQTFNDGSEELVFFAVTDYKLTSRFIDTSESTYRQNKDAAESADEARQAA